MTRLTTEQFRPPGKTPISYYGGKNQLLAELMPYFSISHDIYTEPFFGGGGVFFAKGAAPIEAVSDTNAYICNFSPAVMITLKNLQI